MPSPTIERLLTGFRNFRRNYYVKNQALFQALALRGQSPKVMVIGCCDARVDPMLITGAGPGEIFMLRNVANLVPPYAPDSRSHGTSAALEFAIKTLQVEHIIVLGHAACGGVQALLNEAETAAMGTDFIATWMAIAERARTAANAHTHDSAQSRQRFGELENIKVSLENLRTFPWIAERIDAGKISVHGWYFDIHSGHLMAFDPATGLYNNLDTDEGAPGDQLRIDRAAGKRGKHY
jgi:carbonic anhydrase